ncbi:sulfatase [Svornostia abyssi]|uniref:Sulfatase n=1 Tax=Svornostia abyssi TaxID=2898438 RepID=A0ABY5PB99_9ACTN|nr:sulfatase [Parviterribacteraceae bacterium J379]
MAVVAAISAPAGAPADRTTESAGRPNVVVFMTDDQTLDMMRFLPRTRSLIGGQGVTFSRAYASYPVCCPSRATFLTGQYAHNHKVLSNQPPTGSYYKLRKWNTLPVWLRDAGYDTIHIGKYLNLYGMANPREIPPGWTDWHGSIDPTTYWFYGFTLNHNGKLRRYGLPWVEDPALYQTDVYTSIATDAIRRHAATGKPFLLNVSFGPSHGEISYGRNDQDAGGGESFFVSPRPAQRHRGTLAGERAPRGPGFDEEDLSDKPAWMQRKFGRMTEKTIASLDGEYRARAESLLSVDEAVEAVLGQLDRSGIADDTLVVFTSDNGFLQGEHRIPGGKYVVYEPSTHIPLLMRGPGVAPGATSGELVSNVDLAATIAEVAQVSPKLELDGRSLMPYAADPSRRSARPLLLETTASARESVDGRMPRDPDYLAQLEGIPAYRAIRQDRWLYVAYSDGGRELYDMHRDPAQLRSRYGDPAVADTQRRLQEALSRLQSCVGATCRAAVDVPPPSRPLIDTAPLRIG